MARALASKLAILAALLLLWLAIGGYAAAQEIGIPGFGNLTFFGSANFGILVNEGELGAPVDNDSGVDVDLQNVNSFVGLDYVFDIGDSHKIIARGVYGGDFVSATDSFNETRFDLYWAGVSNGLGALTYGRQPLAFLQYYGLFIDRDQEIYATGYSTPFAGGVTLSDNLIKFASSWGRLEFGVDYQPPGLSSDTAADTRYSVGARYLDLYSRINLGAAADISKTDSGEHVNRFGAAIEYESEQWLVAFGGHVVDDASQHLTKSYNALGIVQFTENNQLHLTASIIDDNDIYDSYYGGGFFLDHRIGSRWTLYTEGALTRAEPAGGGAANVASAVIFGLRYDFGNLWY